MHKVTAGAALTVAAAACALGAPPGSAPHARLRPAVFRTADPAQRTPAGDEAVPPGGATAERRVSPLRDRAAFARALAQVKVGMPRAQVLKLLGPADDVWSGPEVNACRQGFVYRHGETAWAYGGSGHLTFPTLGKVSFDAGGKVVVVVGQGHSLPGRSLPAEPKTRSLLRDMDRLRRYDQSNDPLRVIQVVNALQPLGKQGALAVIDEYLRVHEPINAPDGEEGLFVVVRCLFNVPDPPGYFPTMVVGGPSPAAPKDLRRSPRFPVVLYRDIPFVGINGYRLAGSPESLEWHLKPYRARGTIREQPLRPPDNPLEVVDSLVASPAWPDWGREKAWGKTIAREQALRLVDPVYRVPADDYDGRLRGYADGQENEWAKHLRAFGQVNARWDPARNTYVRPDGTFLPPVPEPNTYPRIWVAATPAGKVEVMLQRHGRATVDISTSTSGARPPMPLMRLFIGNTEIKTGWDQHIPAVGATTTGFRAPEDSDIRVVLERNGKILAQTVLRP